jgi:hypothetical protein
MAKLIRDWLSAIFAVVFLLVAGLTYWRTGQPNYALASVLATLAAIFAGVRFHFLGKPEKARLEAERLKRREDLFNRSCGEVAELMSYLSRADFSVFITCHHMLSEGESSYSFMTARGSPVHTVLVAMTHVRCARPVQMKRIRPGHDASLATYELTKLGKALLEPLMKDAVGRRRARASRAA